MLLATTEPRIRNADAIHQVRLAMRVRPKRTIAAKSWVFIARRDVATVSSCRPAREAVTKRSATSVRNETAMLARPSYMSVHFLGHDQIVHETLRDRGIDEDHIRQLTGSTSMEHQISSRKHDP